MNYLDHPLYQDYKNYEYDEKMYGWVDYLFNKIKNGTITKEENKKFRYLLIKVCLLELSYYDYASLRYFDPEDLPNYSEEEIEFGMMGFDDDIFSKQKEYIPRDFIMDDKIIFFADTHIGCKDENRQHVWNTYNYAINQSIHTAIHLGDLIEGTMNKRAEYINNYGDPFNSYGLVKRQLDMALDIIPTPDLVQTKLLFGNHEYWAFSKQIKLLNDFFSTNKLEILGMQKSFLDWKNNITLGLYHDISQEDRTSNCEDVIALAAHSHVYEVNPLKRFIRVPTLSNIKTPAREAMDVFYQQQNPSYRYTQPVNAPLFITLEQVDIDIILFQKHDVQNLQTIEITDEVEVNTKTKQMTHRKK